MAFQFSGRSSDKEPVGESGPVFTHLARVQPDRPVKGLVLGGGFFAAAVFFVHICLNNSGKSGTGRVDGAKEFGKQLIAGRQFADGTDFVRGKNGSIQDRHLVFGFLGSLGKGVDGLGGAC